MRTGLIDVAGTKIKVIGDAHLGRRFITGVPLHRRGDREKMVMAQFAAELLDVDEADLVVQVGDIFDKFFVPLDVIMATYEAIEYAADHYAIEFYFLRGNHDASRDLEKISAFDILRELCRRLSNVHFITDEPTFVGFEGSPCWIAFAPWHPVKTAVEMATRLIDNPNRLGRGFDVVFAHYDIHSYGGDDSNLIPLEALSKITPLVVTGHDHLPREFEANGMKIIVTGSMQGYAHGEEAEEEMYWTFTREQMERVDVSLLKDKCVRVLLNPGETLPVDIDCFQLTGKRVGVDEEVSLDVDMGTFDMDVLFRDAFAHEGVDPEITAEMTAKFKELRHA
jgi:DNA repair exonuclease SbcCD nuclease subunit